MQIYKHLAGDSGVSGYKIEDTSITVWFTGTSKSYTYSYQSAGQHHIEEMKRLAVRGDGLNAYINRNVKFKYDR